MKTYYLEQHLPFEQHNYAIIDRISVPDIDDSWPVHELILPMLKPQAHLYPWVISFDEMNAKQWQSFFKQLNTAEKPISSILLRSDKPLWDVRNQLIKNMYFTDEANQGHILRYYDPRVLFHLGWMLTPYLLKQILSPQIINHWTYWLEGEWHTLQLTDQDASNPVNTKISSIQQLKYCGLINQVLNKLPIYKDFDERTQISKKIYFLFEQAVQLGLLADDDLIAFADACLIHNHDLWTSDRIKHLTQHLRKKTGAFRDEINSWDETDWQAIVER